MVFNYRDIIPLLEDLLGGGDHMQILSSNRGFEIDICCCCHGHRFMPTSTAWICLLLLLLLAWRLRHPSQRIRTYSLLVWLWLIPAAKL